MLSLLEQKRICILVCNQFGDSGKGLQAQRITYHWADVGVGGQGAANSGRTVYIPNGGTLHEKVVLHTVPTSIVYDHEGKTSIIGPGKLVDLKGLVSGRGGQSELDELDSKGISWENLYFSHNATVTTDFEIEDDLGNVDQGVKDGKGGIGSTGRGVGPGYTLKVSRKGLKLRDFFHGEEYVREKLVKIKKKFYPGSNISVDDVVRDLMRDFVKIKDRVVNTRALLRDLYAQGKNILLEGVNGLGLSIDEGVYPFVTSSDPSADGVFHGAGFTRAMVDPNDIITLGVVKLVQTKVGGGPFAVEYGGLQSERYCDNPANTKKAERAKYSNIDLMKMLQSGNPFDRGIAIRVIAGEYGATTGRPRRIGSFDKNMLRHAVEVNGPYVILTRGDSYTADPNLSLDAFDFAENYEFVGKERERDGVFERVPETIVTAEGRLTLGSVHSNFSTDPYVLERMKGVDFSLPAYGNIRGMTDRSKIPRELEDIIEQGIEEGTGAQVVAVSTDKYLDGFIDMVA
jgi:adenylosuccinate synthase